MEDDKLEREGRYVKITKVIREDRDTIQARLNFLNSDLGRLQKAIAVESAKLKLL